jgi:hypothetical protein
MLYENLNYDGLNASLFWYGSSKEKITYLGTFVFHYVAFGILKIMMNNESVTER